MRDAPILLVEDDEAQRVLLARFLEARGFCVVAVASAAEARAALDAAGEPPAFVLTDYNLEREDGLTVLRDVKARAPGVDVALVTAYGTVGLAVEAMRGGAVDVLLKPVDPDALLDRIRRSLRLRVLASENERLRRRLGAAFAPEGIVAQSEAMRAVLQLVDRVAPTRTPVLVTGETGTGKEVVARLLHERGARPDGAFVAVNLAALPAGLLEAELFGHARGAFTGADRDRAGRFEEADGGTLFLDEVAEIPPAAQAVLLRVLDRGEVVRLGEGGPRAVAVRLVAATNRDIDAEVEARRFRADLYHRLAGVRIHLPPLRERLEDVPPLVRRIVARVAQDEDLPPLGFSDAALVALAGYDFPGNVRELENVVRRALVLAPGPVVEVADLPEALRGGAPGPDAEGEGGLEAALARLERRMLLEALRRAEGVQTRAAALLGVAERVLRYKMAKHGIRREDVAGGR